MIINLGSEKLTAHPSGILLWKRHNMAIVSDLHLEKGSHFAKRGFFIPPYDTHETLQRLLTVCRDEDIQKLIILGDCFHDRYGYDRLDEQARIDFEMVLAFDPVWINGNHDAGFVPTGFTAYDTYEQDGIIFRHIAEDGAVNEISGHFHPKIMVTHKGAQISRPCFVADGSRLILPAFGSYTGGLFVDHPSIHTLFTSPVSYYALGSDRVFKIT